MQGWQSDSVGLKNHPRGKDLLAQRGIQAETREWTGQISNDSDDGAQGPGEAGNEGTETERLQGAGGTDPLAAGVQHFQLRRDD